MLKELVVLCAVSFVLLQFALRAEGCGPVCIELGVEVEKNEDGCRVSGDLKVQTGKGGSGRRRRRRDAPWPAATPAIPAASIPSQQSGNTPPAGSEVCLAIEGCQLFTRENFNYFDRDGNGAISYAEFKQVHIVQLSITNLTCT